MANQAARGKHGDLAALSRHGAFDALARSAPGPRRLHRIVREHLETFLATVREERNGATHLVMTPVQCLARIAALIPPPRFSERNVVVAIVEHLKLPTRLPLARARSPAFEGA